MYVLYDTRLLLAISFLYLAFSLLRAALSIASSSLARDHPLIFGLPFLVASGLALRLPGCNLCVPLPAIVLFLIIIVIVWIFIGKITIDINY